MACVHHLDVTAERDGLIGSRTTNVARSVSELANASFSICSSTKCFSSAEQYSIETIKTPPETPGKLYLLKVLGSLAI